MGNFNSTRWNGHARRRVTSEALKIRSHALRKQFGVAGSSRVLQVAFTGEKHPLVGVPLTAEAVAQPFGGVRWWWRCLHCKSRRAALYIAYQNRLVGCRTCLKLVYEVQRCDEIERLRRRLLRLASRMGDPTADFLPEMPWKKPRGMHTRTFERLADTFRQVRWDRDRVYMTLGRKLLARDHR